MIAPRCRRISALAALPALVAVVFAAGTAAASESTGSDDLPTAVVPPARPTEVVISAYLLGLSRVSEPSSPFPTFDVEMFVDLSWHDPRLAAPNGGGAEQVFQEEEAEEKLSEIWSPDFEIQNEVEQRETESIELRILPDGRVEYEERFGATLNAELDLARFPFDVQTLDLEMQSFLWDEGDCILVANPNQTGFDPDFETPEWVVRDAHGEVGRRSEVRDDRAFSSYTLRIVAERQSGHYVLRFMTPLMFVMLLTWLAFWMPVDQRFRVGFIALLTVVASHTVVSGSLPRLHYPTFADVLLLVCYLFATALIGISIVLQRLDRREDEASKRRAERIDVRTRWALPLGAAVLLGASALVLWF
ncbi:MAG: hypothetical protein QNK04_20785 [Myxococcota bacterium]|nr:hypothetical protein [Myxococcota bacterium]